MGACAQPVQIHARRAGLAELTDGYQEVKQPEILNPVREHKTQYVTDISDEQILDKSLPSEGVYANACGNNYIRTLESRRDKWQKEENISKEISSSEEKINKGKVEALKEASDLAIDIAEEIINNLYVKKVDKKDLNKFSKDLN